jgi:hypothetical protein
MVSANTKPRMAIIRMLPIGNLTPIHERTDQQNQNGDLARKNAWRFMGGVNRALLAGIIGIIQTVGVIGTTRKS